MLDSPGLEITENKGRVKVKRPLPNATIWRYELPPMAGAETSIKMPKDAVLMNMQVQPSMPRVGEEFDIDVLSVVLYFFVTPKSEKVERRFVSVMSGQELTSIVEGAPDNNKSYCGTVYICKRNIALHIFEVKTTYSSRKPKEETPVV